MADRNEFMCFALDKLGYKSKEDLFENLYLKALIDSYRRIEKSSILEEKIRDRFVYDLEWENPLTKGLIQQQILVLTWERWLNVSNEEKSRADISLSISGFEFIIECKRLKHADSRYLEDGIKRFIEGKYAKKDAHAGMMGFIIGGDFGKIINNLKTKVALFCCSQGSEELLKKRCLTWKNSFQSLHDRNDNTTIHLYHLFFDFIPDER